MSVAVVFSRGAVAQSGPGLDGGIASEVTLAVADLPPGWKDTGQSPDPSKLLPFDPAVARCLGQDPNQHMTGTAIGDGFAIGQFDGVGAENGFQIQSTVQLAAQPEDAQHDLVLMNTAKYGACALDEHRNVDNAIIGANGGTAREDPPQAVDPATFGLDPGESSVGSQHSVLSIGSASTDVNATGVFVVVGRFEISVSILSFGLGAPETSVLRTALQSMIGRAKSRSSVGSSPPGAGATVGCIETVTASLEADLAKLFHYRIPLKTGTLTTPKIFAGELVASAGLASASACASQSVASSAPDDKVGTIGAVKIEARDTTTGTGYGPFVYDLPTLRWTNAPGLTDPGGHLSPIGFDFKPVDPTLQLSLSGPAVTIASMDLKVLQSEATLVNKDQAVLKVSLGPVLSLQAQIAPGAVLQAVADVEKSNVGREQAIQIVSAQITADTQIAFQQEGAEFFLVKIDVSSIDAALSSAIDNALLASPDPILGEPPPVPDQLSPGDVPPIEELITTLEEEAPSILSFVVP